MSAFIERRGSHSYQPLLSLSLFPSVLSPPEGEEREGGVALDPDSVACPSVYAVKRGWAVPEKSSALEREDCGTSFCAVESESGHLVLCLVQPLSSHLVVGVI